MPNFTQQRIRPQPQVIAESWADLPERIRALLQLEELDSPAAWRTAGARRRRIFGLVPSMVRHLDQVARSSP